MQLGRVSMMGSLPIVVIVGLLMLRVLVVLLGLLPLRIWLFCFFLSYMMNFFFNLHVNYQNCKWYLC